MGCNSAICTANTSRPVLAADAQIPFGGIVRRFGRNVQLEGNSVVLCGSGYYDVEVSIVLSPTAAGDISVQLYQDGMAIPGAYSAGSATAAEDFVPLSISTLVRNCGRDCNSVIYIVVDGAATLENLSVVVEKV